MLLRISKFWCQIFIFCMASVVPSISMGNDALEQECERYAGSRWEDSYMGISRAAHRVNGHVALRACSLANRVNPTKENYYRLARAMAIRGLSSYQPRKPGIQAGTSDLERALEATQKSATMGYSAAKELAAMLLLVLGPEKQQNRALAFKYANEAAEGGNVIAHRRLGYMYGRGIGVGKDEKKSFEHYEYAASNGDGHSAFQLGILYKNLQKHDSAFEYFSMAATDEDPYGIDALGEIYESGNGVPRDVAKALTLYRAAIKRGIVGRVDSYKLLMKEHADERGYVYPIPLAQFLSSAISSVGNSVLWKCYEVQALIEGGQWVSKAGDFVLELNDGGWGREMKTQWTPEHGVAFRWALEKDGQVTVKRGNRRISGQSYSLQPIDHDLMELTRFIELLNYKDKVERRWVKSVCSTLDPIEWLGSEAEWEPHRVEEGIVEDIERERERLAELSKARELPVANGKLSAPR